MLEYLKADAYTRLRDEITLAIMAELGDEDNKSADFYAGEMTAYCKILAIMNGVHRDLLEDLDSESEKEAAYYSHEKH